MDILTAYVPRDRLQALAEGRALPERSQGAALFADISGFTSLTEALTRALGHRRGVEELSTHLNAVYEALAEEVRRFGGSIIAFAGDAITCWFAGDNGRRAVSAAFAMQAAMGQFANIRLADGETRTLTVKAGVAAGPARRFLVGDPAIQLLDILAGNTLVRMADATGVAAKGEVVVAQEILEPLGRQVRVIEWRADKHGGGRFAVIALQGEAAEPSPWPPLPAVAEADVRPFLIPPVCDRLRGGQGEFLTELRPAVALFLKFGGLDFDSDDDAGAKLNRYLAWVQNVAARYEGYVLAVGMGDKGSHLYCSFGAPLAHENDAWRALAAALELRHPPGEMGFITQTHIGVSAGTMRTGAYGASARRTYGVLGDDVNLAARLMEHASDGEILANARVHHATRTAFDWRTLPPINAKGKSGDIPAFALQGLPKGAAPRLTGPTYSLPLVGRATELQRIEELTQAARSGRGQLICLTAEAGLGKSRLVAEAIRLANERGLAGFGGQCQSHGTNTSYHPWWNIWRGLFALEEGSSPSEVAAALDQRLSEVAPSLVPRLPLLGAVLNVPIADNDVTAPLDAKLRKASLEALLADCLRALTAEQPALIVIEDVHWSDSLSLDLLEVIARQIARLPVLLLVTRRPPETGREPMQASRPLPHFTEFVLSAFSSEEAKRLVQLKLAQLFHFQGPPPQALTDRLIPRCAGNPFYLEQLLNFLKDQRADFEDAEAIEELELPSSLHSLVLSRIDRLTASEQMTIKLASAIGRLFPAVVLYGLRADTERAQTASDLARLEKVDLTSLDRPEPELAYLFKQVVAQEVAYESLPFATREKLHNEVGLCIERLHAGQLDQQVDLLAFHFDRSANLAKKREYLLKAGDAAQARYANTAAVSYYERALPLLEAGDRIETLLKLGKVRELTGEWKAAGACYQRAFEVAGQLGDRLAQARCEAATGDLLRKQGLFAEALDWLDVARSHFSDLQDDAGVGQSLHAAGTVFAMQGDYAAAKARYDESLRIRRAIKDRPQTASLLSNLSILARFQGQLAESRRMAEESLAIRRELGDRWAIANSLNNLGVLLRDIGELTTARNLLEESLALNRQVGDRWAVANVLSSLAEVALDQKDFDGIRGVLGESLAINRELGDRTAIAFVFECSAVMAAAQNRPDDALRFAGAALGLREEAGSPLSPTEQARLDQHLADGCAALDNEQRSALIAQGKALGLDAAELMQKP